MHPFLFLAITASFVQSALKCWKHSIPIVPSYYVYICHQVCVHLAVGGDWCHKSSDVVWDWWRLHCLCLPGTRCGNHQQCDQQPCKNGGRCTDTNYGPVCTCQEVCCWLLSCWAVQAGLLTSLTFTWYCLNPLAALLLVHTFFTVEDGDSEYVMFTLPL